MNRKTWIIVSVLVVVSLAWYLTSLFDSFTARRVLSQRREDVRVLTRICIESPNVTNTDQMFSIVEQKGIRLHNPIPKNPSQRCYRLAQARSDSTPNEIMIVEENITDNRMLVAATMDGVVFVQARSNVQDISK